MTAIISLSLRRRPGAVEWKTYLVWSQMLCLTVGSEWFVQNDDAMLGWDDRSVN